MNSNSENASEHQITDSHEQPITGCSTDPIAEDIAERSAESITEPIVGSEKSAKKHILAMLAVACGILALDQLTKWWALESLDDGNVIDIVWTLRFRLVFNTGSAFGRFQDMGPLLGVLAIVLIVWLMWFMRTFDGLIPALAIGGIAGGAAGNLADRMLKSKTGFFNGAVIDFIDVQWWPVWNVADMGIVMGAVTVMWYSWHAKT